MTGSGPRPPPPPGSPTKPVVFGHRGASRERPENSMPAFRRACEVGAAIECDVRGTQDGEVVVLHDATVDRTTDGRGEVRAMSLDQVRRLDAGFRFVGRDGGRSWAGRGVQIPTLDQVLSAFVPEGVPINVDIAQTTPCIVAAVVARLRDHAARRAAGGGHGDALAVVLTSEDRGVKQAIEAHRPPCALGLCRRDVLEVVARACLHRLLGTAVSAPARLAGRALQLPADARSDLERLLPARLRPLAVGLAPLWGCLLGTEPLAPGALPLYGRTLAAFARASRMPVHLWGVDDPDQARRWLALGAAGVFTDDPAAMVEGLGGGPTHPALAMAP